ncbi:histidine kinase [Nocardia sp. BMG111209]|uniref:sensor histidine kinase n=1 Tax=Nocardia sp. BMG111209 TaxID=1160137 RepID=UPI00036C33D0|nr:histidine kinase [Nocardia sp. BMG111209]
MRATVRQAARASAYLVRALALAFGCVLFVTVLLLTVVGAVTVVGLGLLPETVLLIRRIAGTKRRWVQARTGRALPEAYLPIDPPLRDSLRAIRRDPCTYGDLRWLLAHYLYGFLGLAAVPLWPIGLVVDGVWCGLLGRTALVLPLIDRLAELDTRWSVALLRPPPKALLAERVQELTATRAGAVAAHGAELRRIERDLHDGTQARLVALSMRIGLARRAFDTDPQAARTLLDDAQSQAEQALVELRHVVRGIHPPILTDRGLSGAVRALAAGSGLTVTVDADELDDPPRAPAAVEAAAYYVVAEALTNAAKYSGGERAEVRLTRTRTGVRVLVRDEGDGGAHLPDAGETGSGLLGIRRRVAALDGTFTLTSPVGGPTCIEAELPCVW